jgi:hypothetical protein
MMMVAARAVVISRAMIGVSLPLTAGAHCVAAAVRLEAYPAALDARRLDEKPSSVAWTGVVSLTPTCLHRAQFEQKHSGLRP